jgi:hypothetical protein
MVYETLAWVLLKSFFINDNKQYFFALIGLQKVPMTKKYPAISNSSILKQRPSEKSLDFILSYSKSIQVKDLKKGKVVINLN